MFVVVLTVRACQRSTRFGRRHFPCVTMITPPNADIAVKTHTKFATKANPRLLYIVLSFGAVSSDHSFRSHHSCRCHVHLHKSHLFFVPYHFLYNRLSNPYLFPLSLERFTLRITLRKPSKDPQRAFSPSPLPRGIGHAALSYSLAAVNLLCLTKLGTQPRFKPDFPLQLFLANFLASLQYSISSSTFPAPFFSSSLYAKPCPPDLLPCPKAGHPRCLTL